MGVIDVEILALHALPGDKRLYFFGIAFRICATTPPGRPYLSRSSCERSTRAAPVIFCFLKMEISSSSRSIPWEIMKSINSCVFSFSKAPRVSIEVLAVEDGGGDCGCKLKNGISVAGANVGLLLSVTRKRGKTWDSWKHTSSSTPFGLPLQGNNG